MFGIPMVLVWLAFGALWSFSSGTLGTIWHWIQGLPLVLEIIVWIVFLPWVVSLWIWHSSLPLWARILLILAIAFATLGGSSNGSRRRRARRTAPQPPLS